MRARISQSAEAHLHTRRARRNECCPVPLCSSLTVQRYRKILQICQLHIANLRLKCYFFVMAAFSSSPWGSDFLRPGALSVAPPRSGKHSLPTNRLFLEESEGRVLIFFYETLYFKNTVRFLRRHRKRFVFRRWLAEIPRRLEIFRSKGRGKFLRFAGIGRKIPFSPS